MIVNFLQLCRIFFCNLIEKLSKTAYQRKFSASQKIGLFWLLSTFCNSVDNSLQTLFSACSYRRKVSARVEKFLWASVNLFINDYQFSAENFSITLQKIQQNFVIIGVANTALSQKIWGQKSQVPRKARIICRSDDRMLYI